MVPIVTNTKNISLLLKYGAYTETALNIIRRNDTIGNMVRVLERVFQKRNMHARFRGIIHTIVAFKKVCFRAKERVWAPGRTDYSQVAIEFDDLVLAGLK